MTSTFRNRLLAGRHLIGTLITLPSPDITEILAGSGFDWLFIDLEHSTMGAGDAQRLLQAAGTTPCLIRIKTSDEAGIRQALDSGAQGIIVPRVNSAEEAAQFVSWAKYPPQGTRGVGLGRAQGFGLKFQTYVQQANEETVVVVQIEHKAGVANIDAILAVPGIDAVLIGPYDLSSSLGKPGVIDDAEVQAAITHVFSSCRSHHIAVGIFTTSTAAARQYLAQGFSLLAFSSDALLLGQAAGRQLEAIRANTG